MLTIAEKLGFVKAEAVKVCTRTGILSSQEFSIWSFVKNCEETASEEKILTIQADSCKIIGSDRSKLWFVTAQMGNSG